jgi:hypothetical protein
MHAAASIDRSASSFGDRREVRVGRGAGVDRDVAAGLDDAVERGAVDDEVLHQREARGAPGLDDDLVAVGEAAHVQLARRGARLRAVGLPVDHQPAGAADALAAVVGELDRLLAGLDEPLVDDVEHLEERRVLADVGRLVGLEPARRVRSGLPPHSQREVHL